MQFFQETFLLANTNIEIVLEILFLSLNNVDLKLGATKLTWRTDIAVEIMPAIEKVELIDKYIFIEAALNK